MDTGENNIQADGVRTEDIFVKRISALSEKISSFRNSESEDDLHDSRVNARKLQTLFSSLGHLVSDASIKDFSDITDALIKGFGRSRELDVCAEMTEDYTKTVKIKDSFISGFRYSLLRKIKKERKKLLGSDLIRNFNDIEEQMIEYFSGEKIFPPDTGSIFGEVILNQFDNLITMAEEIPESGLSGKLLHDIRIKSKPLRYNIEFVSEYCGIELSECHRVMKKFVETAGSVHDTDVLISRIRKYIKETRPLPPLARNSSVKIIKYLKRSRKAGTARINEIIVTLKSDKFRDDLHNSLFKNNV